MIVPMLRDAADFDDEYLPHTTPLLPMKRLSTLLLSSVLAFGLLFAVGCDATGSSGTTDGESGSLQLTMSGSSTGSTASASTKMPDNPTATDVDTALVTISEVSIVPSEDSTEGDSTEIGVTALTDSNFTVDLKNLQAGIDAALPEIDIPAGTYSQLRLVTADEAQVSFSNTTGTQDVMIASGQQTGLKVNFPEQEFTVDDAGDRVEITVNWDVDEALKGGGGNYVITPAINDVEVNVTDAGN
jgi:hypothetical protein